MLCKDKITSIFCIIDDILKEINHSEDIRRKVSNSEIVTTAFIAATNFYGNHRSAIKFVKQYNLFPNMLEESRFNSLLKSPIPPKPPSLPKPPIFFYQKKYTSIALIIKYFFNFAALKLNSCKLKRICKYLNSEVPQ